MMNIWSDLWELFFPRYCVVCGERLSKAEESLCFRCLSSLPRTNLHLRADNEMEKCLWGKLPVERATAFLYYAKGGDVRKLIYELKYYRNARIGRFLGRWMASELASSGFFRDVDYVIPVPLHGKKQRERGYNQSEMLADGVSAVTGCRVLHGALLKSRNTETQTRKNHYERWLNVKDVFEYVPVTDLAGKHVLLVDDVFTTGATVVACADALGKIPGLRVSVLALALAGES